MAGLYAPLPTLRRRPRGRLRTDRGRRGLLLLHRSGLSPHTPCQSPGALTRVAACTLARSPYVVTAIRRLQTLRLLHVCSGRFRLERSPGGACTHWKSAALSRRTWKCWTLEMAEHLISKRLLEVISQPICWKWKKSREAAISRFPAPFPRTWRQARPATSR